MRELLSADVLTQHSNAVHTTAIEAAARMCERRGHSLAHDSGNLTAALEAGKCATAIRRLRDRATLADQPALTAPCARVEGSCTH